MRLFAAIRPPETVQWHLDAAVDDLRFGIGEGLRWVPREQRHVTVTFFGEVPDGAVDDIVADLAGPAADCPPLGLHLRGAGSFTGRTLWTGVGGDTAPLLQLMAAGADLGAGLSPARPESRERRRAHLTLARSGRRSAGIDLDILVHALAVYVGPTWTATEMELFSSHLGKGRSGGPLHEVIATLPLGPSVNP